VKIHQRLHQGESVVVDSGHMVAFEEGVLTVGVSTGPWGAQATFLAEQIRLKANQALGSDVIATVRIVVRNSR